MAITNFRGRYGFLSNFYKCEVTLPIKGKLLTFRNSEAAFQAMKDISRAEEFCMLAPAEAKKLGRWVTMRANWEVVKDDVMHMVLWAKFTQNEDLKKLLLETGEEELVEGNTWNDHYWGVCDGYGKNMLGNLLMTVRSELRG